MSFFVIYLYLTLVLPFSSATDPFDQLRADGYYSMTTYNNSFVDPAGPRPTFSFGISTNWVNKNLQPNPQDNPPQTSRGARARAAQIPQMGYIHCSEGELPVSDCEAAINIIPTGHLIFDPQNPLGTRRRGPWGYVKFRASLPRPLRKFFLPAAFRAGQCVVYVRHRHFNENSKAVAQLWELPATFSAAEFMYHTVWPNSRRLAELITKKCGGRGGFTSATTSPEWKPERFGTFRYTVMVASPRGHIVDRNFAGPYNLYRPE
jgi:hypothetical protein